MQLQFLRLLISLRGIFNIISSFFHLFEALLNELTVNFRSAPVEFLVVRDLVLAAFEPLLDVGIFVQDLAVDGLSTNDIINTLSLSAVVW
jgi:hypothetical protein